MSDPQEDLLSMLDGLESALMDIVEPAAQPAAPPPSEAPARPILQLAPPPPPSLPDVPRPEADPFPIERARHPDPPARYAGVVAARDRAGVALASFRWGDPTGGES